jgi:hypothetical protein
MTTVFIDSSETVREGSHVQPPGDKVNAGKVAAANRRTKPFYDLEDPGGRFNAQDFVATGTEV